MKTHWIVFTALFFFQSNSFAFPVTFKKLKGTVYKSGKPYQKTVFLVGDYHNDENIFSLEGLEADTGEAILNVTAAFYKMLRKLKNTTLITETPDSPKDIYNAPEEAQMLVKFAVATKMDKKLFHLRHLDGDFMRKKLFWEMTCDYLKSPIFFDIDGSLFAKYSGHINAFIKEKSAPKEHFFQVFGNSLDNMAPAEQKTISQYYNNYLIRLVEMSRDSQTLFNNIERAIIQETANLEMLFNVLSDDNPNVVLYAGAKHLDKQFKDENGAASVDTLLEGLGFKEAESAAIIAPDQKMASSSKAYKTFEKKFIENSGASFFSKMFSDLPSWVYEGF